MLSQPVQSNHHDSLFDPTACPCVTLKVFDVLGREVAVLVDEIQQAGTHTANFNVEQISNLPVRQAGLHYSSGVYFYRLSAGGKSITRKLILIR